MLNDANSVPPPLPPPPQPVPGKSPACAACKHQRKKCVDTCVFAPYFPPGLAREFHRAQKVFGVSNMAKMAAGIPVGHRGLFFESVVYEAELRYLNPVTGCAGQVDRLRRQNCELRHEVEVLREKVRVYEDFFHNNNGNGNGFVYNISDQHPHDNCANLNAVTNNSNSNNVVFYSAGSTLLNGERGKRADS
ncbi:uncharacterized protein A4U43_C06F10730 [Asparagus officinalis]|uniref:LOB domain-containing protein n=1 Tax=Asparagus officinalis TaxID=4686 RepID=A0A5P1ENE7_ASPOF|nr:LOB domain-containing protein 21-like [Asparagus officinalis]ONK66667.1 uncharacterized protein A4U43_C06F10730 [Asparagus officinalis]